MTTTKNIDDRKYRQSSHWSTKITYLTGLFLVALMIRKSTAVVPVFFQDALHWTSDFTFNHKLVAGIMTLLTWTAWTGILRFLGREEFDELPTPVVILAAIGWGSLLTLALVALNVELSPYITKLVLFLPFVVLVAILAISHRNRSPIPNYEARPPTTLESLIQSKPKLAFVIKLGCFIFGSALLIQIIKMFFWLSYQKGPAVGDELFYWWSSFDHLLKNGLTHYLRHHPVANYSPGYPLATNFLLLGLPEQTAAAGVYILPWLQGIALMAFILPLRKIRTTPTFVWLFAILTATTLLVENSWIRSMMFQLWYGEALAILCVASLLTTVFDTSIKHFALRAFILIGVGAISLLSKPPLSLLILPAALPTLFIVGLVTFPAITRRRWIINLTLLFVGALTASQIWNKVLIGIGRGAVYKIDKQALSQFYWNESYQGLLSYLYQDYKPVFIFYTLTSVIILAKHWRRHLASWLVCTGLIGSIFFLYLTIWHHIEFESGVRYVLHGLLGWLLFVWAKHDARIDQLL